MTRISREDLLNHPLTPLVQEQLARVYEETDYLLAGSLGRTAVMGEEPTYWYRRHGNLRDLDVHDPYRNVSAEVHAGLNHNPLPIDRTGFRWLRVVEGQLSYVFPVDEIIKIGIPESFVDPVGAKILGVPVRTFRPEVLMGINAANPYSRLRQRRDIERFNQWVIGRPDYDPSVQIPFLEIALTIESRHPEYIRGLMMRDLANQLPTPLFKRAQSLYHALKKAAN